MAIFIILVKVYFVTFRSQIFRRSSTLTPTLSQREREPDALSLWERVGVREKMIRIHARSPFYLDQLDGTF